MSTNYYVAKNLCECCERYDEEYHIGKSSYGWSFNFRGYRSEGLESWKQWREFLRDKIIMDEYGDRIEYCEFVDMIETYKSPEFVLKNGKKNLQHNEQGRVSKLPWFDDRYDWDDDDGYAFTSKEFS